MSRVETREAEPAGLPGLQRQFRAWRARKRSGEEIPPNLWAGAASLARRHGAGRIALALGLDSHKLKQMSLGRWPVRGTKRVGAQRAMQGKPSVAESGGGARFIELKAPAVTSAPREGEAVVELLAADGARITLRLTDSSPALAAVITALRGRP